MSTNEEKRTKALEIKKKFIGDQSSLLCTTDDQKKIDLVYYILAYIDDDSCAPIHDYATNFVEGGS